MHVPVLFGTRQSIDYAASSLAWLSDAGSVIHAKNGGGRGCFTLDAKPLSSGDVLHVELEMQMHGNPRQGGPWRQLQSRSGARNRSGAYS